MINKKRKNITSALVLSLVSMGVLGVGIHADAATPNETTTVSKANLLAPNILRSLTRADTEIDISTDWDVQSYSSDLGVSINKVFAQGQTASSGMKYATTNFFNIGKSNFKATKTIAMKKGKTYDLDLEYAVRAQGKAVGSIDFNGTKATVLTGINTNYTEKVVAKKDQNYVITMEFTAPKNSGMYLMVGAKNLGTGGVQVTPNVAAPEVNTPEAGTNFVSGTGKSGNTIKVMNNLNEVIGTGEVKPDGSFEVTTDKTLNHNDKLTIVQSNGEDESDPVPTTVTDSIAPESPAIQGIEVSDQLIKGTAEANSTITVKNASGAIIGKGTTDANGKVEFKLTTAAAIGEKVLVTATDGAGNTSRESEVEVVDTSVPAAPDVEKMTDEQATLSGNAWKPGSRVEIKVGNQYYYVNSGLDNKFAFTFSKPWKVGTVITVKTTDKSGNISPETAIVVTSEARTNAPVIDKVGDTHTKITGTAEANSFVDVTIGNDYYKGKADSQGHFSIAMNQAYPEGTRISVTATGISGKVSEKTEETVEDTTPPGTLIVKNINDKDEKAEGSTEANAKVEAVVITPNGDKHYFETTADENGGFIIDLDGTFPANSTIVVTATDANGNTSAPEEKQVENSVEIGIAVDTITSQSDSVIGETARPNTAVIIKVNNQIFKARSDENGEFKIALPKKYDVGTKYEFYTIDGSEKTPVELGTVLPRVVTFLVDGLKPNSTVVTGEADPGGRVTVIVTRVGNVVSNTETIAGVDGKFSVTLDTPLAAYDDLEATQVVGTWKSEIGTGWVGNLRR